MSKHQRTCEGIDCTRLRGHAGPWQLALIAIMLLAASVPYFWSIAIAMMEFGDPPFTENDGLENLLLASWLSLFSSAIMLPLLTGNWRTARSIAILVFIPTLFGLFCIL